MAASDRYTLTEILTEGTRFVVHRGVRNEDGCRVVIKTPRAAHPDRRDAARLRHELEIGRRLDSQFALKPCALTTYRDRPALVLEDFRGCSLDRLLGAPMELAPFLALAARIAAALADIHAKGIIHKDIKPHNILVDVASGEVKIADFDLASVAPVDMAPASLSDGRSPHVIEGTLGYMSPEQTGRMSRVIDHRSDLYSLGVTLYEMLTGVLPFSAGDALEWVYCHTAVSPRPPAELVPGLPPPVSAIVLKLLAKAAEDRYQSARGLGLDLERCLEGLTTRGHIAPFSLGAHDFSGRFRIPQRLYGRERETSALRGAFERLVERGGPELLLVSGGAGVGKSSLVRELYAPIARERGVFAAGKFDQVHRHEPYSTLSRALRDLVLGILGGSETTVDAWRGRLSAALGEHARLITELIPEVELILGEPPRAAAPPLSDLPPTDAQSRFAAVFRRFLGAFCEERPLCLFLDDLHWADPESLALLEQLVTHPEARRLIAIGAYRDNEAGPAHPLRLMLERARSAGASIGEIELSPLSAADVERLIADTVQRSLDDVAPLARLVHEKTAGNPLFATQFLTMLHGEGLIEADLRAGAFRWDIDAIRGKGFADNVVDLMITKIRRLSRGAQRALTLAACVGNTVDTATLAVVRDRPEDTIHEDHAELVREGLLLRSGDTYRFLHDRVQQAAYALVPDEERAAVHLHIGRLLAAHLPPEAAEARLFEIAGHLNLGSALVTDPRERDRIARLDLLAGQRARASAAYAAAAGYLAAGAALLADDAWETEHALALDLHLERAWCAFLTGDFAEAERLVGALKQRARIRLDLAEIHRLEIDLHTTTADFERAARSALSCVSRFGIDIPLRPAPDEVEAAAREAWGEVRGRRLEALVGLPRMCDPDTKAVMTLLSTALPSAYYTDPGLYDLIACHMVRLSLRAGNSDTSPPGYVAFGGTIGRVLGLYRESYGFGELAHALLEREGRTGSRAQILHMIGTFIDPWIRPFRDVLGLFHRGFEEAVATGALIYASYCCFHIVALRLASGDPLEDVAEEAERRLEFTRRARYDAIHDLVATLYRLVQTLRGKAQDPGAAGAPPREVKAPLTPFYEHLYRAQAALVLGSYGEAVAAARAAGELLGMATGQLQVAEHCYCSALALSCHARALPAEQQRELLPTLRAHEAALRGWAEIQPANQEARRALVSAEIARVAGDELAAMRLYEQAICAARAGGSLQNEALAQELAAQFYRDGGFDLIADTYLRAARSSYARWGADGKVKLLDRLFPHLEARPLASTATVTMPAEELDRLAVVKASQSISGEILVPRLEEALLRVVLEHAGAQQGCLLDAARGAVTIRARARIEGGKAFAEALPDEARAPASASVLPLSIVNYVARTREPVVLDDAVHTRFAADEYVARARPRSVLCMPVARRPGHEAILYLENGLLRGAFSKDTLAVLDLLSSQAAISLENASLYAALRKSQEELQAIIDNSPAIIYVKDLEGRLLLINRRFEQVVHLPRQQVIGKRDHDLFPREAADLFAAHDRRVIETGEPLDIEEVVPQDDGLHTYLSLKFTLRDAAGAVYAVCGISTDITERKRVEVDNARLYREAQRAVALREEFLSVASHELRTPLTPLKLKLGLLQKKLAAERASPALDGLVASSLGQVERLERLVESLLDVAHVGRGGLVLGFEEVDLAELTRGVAREFDQALSRAGCRLDLDAPRPVLGRFDRLRVEQVLRSLLGNAVKFGRGRPIEVGVEGRGDAARVTVRDHGLGIAPGDLERIFERFERAVSSRSYGGLGLGLYIAHEIVRAHGGTIQVESAEGEGACFTVELPRGG
ncbi:protein kinase [Sorangium cellulosum]|uniref:histidine kinase n=1 Tax=Sorangium cellulosum TaxID=56 RepID=A0A2L0F0K6_SORCE|nr:AAA family ATPase [Sorangium cellulosum]AUX45097.1 protein kinase [Sorangium cellulosum]